MVQPSGLVEPNAMVRRAKPKDGNMSPISFEEVYANAYIRESVSVFVEQQTRLYPILASHGDDIEQEMWICISRAIRLFRIDGAASVETFVRKVIERRINNIRDLFFTESSKRQFYSEDIDCKPEIPIYTKDRITLADLRMDLAVAMKNLTAEQRMVCLWIMRGDTFTAIAKRLGIPESSFFHFYIYPIRNEFKKEKMEKYLENL